MAECAAEYRTAARLMASLPSAWPDEERAVRSDVDLRRDLTQTLLTTEEVYRALGRDGDARDVLREAAANQDELLSAYPWVPAYQDERAECDHRLADADRRAGRLADAGFRRALALREPSAVAGPAHWVFGLNYAADCVGLGRVAVACGEPAVAADWAGRAAAKIEVLKARDPDWAAGEPTMRSALPLRTAGRVSV